MTQSKVPGPNLGTVTVGGTVVEKQDQTAIVQTTWTSATTLNSVTASYAVTGYGTANVGVTVPTTATAGAVTVEVSQDAGTTWVPAPAVRQDNGAWESPIALAYYPGVNGTRIYAVSVDAFTHVRAKLTTVIVGTGNTVVSITAVAGGIEPYVTQRSRKLQTYAAVYKGATRPYQLANTFTANTRKQYATIFHASTATKTVRVRRCQVEVMAIITSAAELNIELVRLTNATTPATGNPAITPVLADGADAAAEATCLALPTTAGTEGAVWSSRYLNLGITGAASTTSPPATWPEYEMVNGGTGDDESKFPAIRAGVAEGWALVIDCTTTAQVWARVTMQFTEETP